MCEAVLEADLQDLAVVADEPTIMRVCKSDGPIATHVGHHVPRAAFVGSPGRRSLVRLPCQIGVLADSSAGGS